MFGLLGALNLGEQLFTAGLLAIVAWYLFRGKSAAGTVVKTMGTMATIALGVLGVLAFSIALGWFDPQPSVIVGHVSSAVSAGVDFVRGVLMDWITGLMP